VNLEKTGWNGENMKSSRKHEWCFPEEGKSFHARDRKNVFVV
jgi:hypothetical protein